MQENPLEFFNQPKVDSSEHMLASPAYLEHWCRDGMEKQTILPLLQEHLLTPLTEFVSRPSKALRASLVEAGFEAVHCASSTSHDTHKEALSVCAQVIELLHAGSLIVDDFQDKSLTRRGKPCFYRIYGADNAINSGNWLYIWPLRLMSAMDIEASKKVALQESYCRALEAAHYGQALDIGVRVDELGQYQVASVCQWVTRHKTGAITTLALELGAIVAGANERELKTLADFGCEFGVLLQNYDDLGSLLGHQEQAKRYEDLINRSPSWVWALVASRMSCEDYEKFKSAVKALEKDDSELQSWIHTSGFIDLAKTVMGTKLESLKTQIRDNLNHLGQNQRQVLSDLTERLSYVYTKVLT